ncbi:hypothetical protein, partial [Acidithiobacillus marinus]|uniref:hypothetical protein n=1 Tax=Acidithiobacillus marinus TaxID=187490 RepID=UPI001C0EFA84
VFGESWDFHAAKVTAFILRSPEKPFVLLHQQLRWKVDRALPLLMAVAKKPVRATGRQGNTVVGIYLMKLQRPTHCWIK